MRRMMVDIPIPQKWKRLWDTWDLRSFIILSLCLQTFLILVAPLRKKTKSNWIVMSLWSAYVLADSAANFAVGLISNSQGNPISEGRTPVENEDLLAFWAPFLLVHLGGPDTITAFALEDNELWLRHLLGLVFQCVAAVYVFVQSLPHNRLWIPTMLMFVTGIIKYAERTRSLYLASADRFKDSVPSLLFFGPQYEIVLDTEKKASPGNLTELEVVQYGYENFQKIKGLIVNITFSSQRRDKSREFFLNRTAKDAFKVVEVELNFIYDVLFTKLPVVFGSVGAISRFFSLATVCSAIVLFTLKNKSNFREADVNITYGLLFGALILDMIALIMLLLSDWTIISLRKSPHAELDKSLKTKIVTYFLRLMTQQATVRDTKDEPQYPKPFLKRRWSETVSTYNLITYCLYPRPKLWQSVYDKLGISLFLDGIFNVKSEKFTSKLGDFIFEELKSKSEIAESLETATIISSAQGDWVLEKEDGWSSLLEYFEDIDYDQRLILWHITTELCYNYELNDEFKRIDSVNANKDKREIAKLLSDYMMYLLIMQPSMMSAIAGSGEIWFRHTCDEARRIFEDGGKSIKPKKLQNIFQGAGDIEFDLKKINACIEILNKSEEIEKAGSYSFRDKMSLLFHGSMIAKDVMEIEKKEPKLNKWCIISKVWVELLCYGASHSRATAQAAQVSKGGELITIVWLLMTHFGLGYNFQIMEGQAGVRVTR
ncbi:uncharacterized protein [Rutidosis leptorrhynchoides]|uniref:uncharacterized protein n=1 Tax=Rutidosis leptorrhynchoides TaxID=125765 RepID=UPI003A98D5B2